MKYIILGLVLYLAWDFSNPLILSAGVLAGVLWYCDKEHEKFNSRK